MIANRNDKNILILFISIQTLITQAFMIIMKSYSLGTGKDFISFLTSLCLYIFLFIGPTVFYLKYIDKVNPLNYLKLDSNVLSGIIKAILISGFIVLFFLLKNKTYSLRHISFRADIFLILGKMLVGPLEEIPFRGFYLQKFKESMGFLMANLISSALFASMHIIVMLGSTTNLIYSFVYIMIIGLWMGYIFEKTKSLWCVSIIHSIYDLAIWLLF